MWVTLLIIMSIAYLAFSIITSLVTFTDYGDFSGGTFFINLIIIGIIWVGGIVWADKKGYEYARQDIRVGHSIQYDSVYYGKVTDIYYMVNDSLIPYERVNDKK